MMGNIPLAGELRSVHGRYNFASRWAKKRTKQSYETFAWLVVINEQVNRFTFTRSWQTTEQNGYLKYS